MTRTLPAYTVRWSSQVSRVSNRNPPTAAPNAISSATPSTVAPFGALFSHIRQIDVDPDSSHSVDLNKPPSNTPDGLRIGSPVLRYSTYRVDSIAVFQLIIQNKFSCLLISLWIYRFVFVVKL